MPAPKAGTHHGNKLTAEIAATTDHRTTGLMHRFSLKPDHGMLFVFRESQPQAFWMRNTYIPLSIAFIAADGRIVSIDDMKPQTEDSHYSKGPALYALEMRKGWFAQRGIGPGATVEGIAAAFACAETVPTILRETHPELRGILPVVKRAWPAEAVTAAFETLGETVMVNDLGNRDGSLHRLEIHIDSPRHRSPPLCEGSGGRATCAADSTGYYTTVRILVPVAGGSQKHCSGCRAGP